MQELNYPPVFVWRDRNIRIGFNDNIFNHNEADIHLTTTTKAAIKIINKFKTSRSVHVITNGRDNAPDFIRQIRDELKLKTEINVFTSDPTYHKTWASKYDNVTVMNGKENLLLWVKQIREKHKNSIVYPDENDDLNLRDDEEKAIPPTTNNDTLRLKQERIMKMCFPSVTAPESNFCINTHISYWNVRDVLVEAAEANARNAIEYKAANHKVLDRYEREIHGTVKVSEANINHFSQCKNVSQCEFTIRVMNALDFYGSLDISNSENEKTKLVEFCHNKCETLLDDYIHILTVHNNENDLEQIFHVIVGNRNECNMQHCYLLFRHYRRREIISEDSTGIIQTQDEEYLFYRNIMDQIHCYLYHLFDVVLRVEKKHKTIVPELHENKANHVDTAFLNIHNIIKTKKQQLPSAISDTSTNRYKNNKFNVIMVNQNDEGTFMDGLFEYLQNDEPVEQEKLERLLLLVTEEEYDSESIEYDINLKVVVGKDSNIAQQNKQIYDSVKRYVLLVKLHQHTFHVGYRLYYWKHYKSPETINRTEWHDNINDHGSYNMKELCVEQKYPHLKHEMLNNKICVLSRNQLTISMKKASKYIATTKAKSMKATPDYGDQLIQHDRNDELHYGIVQGTLISFNHLLAVILYTDWSDLCSNFSATFRKAKSYQPIWIVVKNNSEYANWSRLIRETVELFGISWSGQYNANYCTDEDKIINRLKGPFFCGMGFVMILPTYNVRLCGPTSTSKTVEVATTFGGSDGIIIQLNNNKNVNVFSDNVCGFSCVWLSDHAGEDEYLFCGGRHRLRIETITILQTNESFVDFFAALYHFECILIGIDPDNVQKTSSEDSIVNSNMEAEDQFIEYAFLDIPTDKPVKDKTKDDMTKFERICIKNLINHHLQIKSFKNKYPTYINQTFTAFVSQKTQIVINLPIIHENKWCSNLLHLVVNKLSPTYNTTIQENVKHCFTSYSTRYQKPKNVDLFTAEFFKLFANVNNIIIYSTSLWGNQEYAFDCYYFASSVFSNANHNVKIQIKAVDRYNYYFWHRRIETVSWLREEIHRHNGSVGYKDEKMVIGNICMEITRGANGIGRHEDCLTICRNDESKT